MIKGDHQFWHTLLKKITIKVCLNWLLLWLGFNHPGHNMRSNLSLGVSNERSGVFLSLITLTASLDILLLVTFFKIVFPKMLHTMTLYLNLDLAWRDSRSRENSNFFHLVNSLGHKKWETTWSQIFWELLAIWHTLLFWFQIG